MTTVLLAGYPYDDKGCKDPGTVKLRIPGWFLSTPSQLASDQATEMMQDDGSSNMSSSKCDLKSSIIIRIEFQPWINGPPMP
ncbi:MAG: hypothetical protein HKO86_06950 [Gammaproteobacteria bacterium]|nr:hypothetical protein [Gammaproteobacteria bacterium]NNL07445.1 hypothetical protein [Gammaproteobacteria bacterium]